MIIPTRAFFGIGPWLAVALLLGGCLIPTRTATLYSLQPMHQQPLRPAAAPPAGMILLMPIQVAPHLQGRSLLYLDDSGESRNSAGHIWSATLDRQIGQRMTVQLQDLLATANVALYPGPRFGDIRCQVEIELQEFSGNARLFSSLATYTISDTTAKRILTRKTFRQNRVLDNPDYFGYVTSASQAVADLSREVAITLLAVCPQTSPDVTRYER
jgi:uncharacterized lipoprotein YmbA